MPLPGIDLSCAIALFASPLMISAAGHLPQGAFASVLEKTIFLSRSAYWQ
jgi:hypothetical protein